jgi:hypothetical protein
MHQTWMKLVALILVVAGLGLPVNDLPRYFLLLSATVLVVTGSVSARPLCWLGALTAVATGLLLQTWLASPRIEEGHNVFVVDRADGALEASLPPQVFRLMLAEFDARYPPRNRCDPAQFGCWRGQGFPDRPFAFSADGIYDRASYSRRVRAINFSDPTWLRLGFVNELRYNWISDHSDVQRASRRRGLSALVHPWKLEMPWYVMYRFPAEFAGSALCWRGEVVWPTGDDQFEAITHTAMQCRTLTPEDDGRQIFGIAIKPEPALAMRLMPSAAIAVRQLVEPAIALSTWAAILFLLVRPRPRAVVLSFALIALALMVAFLNDASFIGGVRPFDSGDDGLVYDGLSRSMLRHLIAGDIAGALEGGEKVFYFLPGMRYFRAVEHLAFGETYLGYLSLILLLPFLVFMLFRRFLPLRWALALVVIFAAIPVGMLFGSSLVQYVKWAARGFADPAAYTAFLAALMLLIGRRDAGPPIRFGPAVAAGVLFALALFLRPNIAPAAAVLLVVGGFAVLRCGQYRRVAGLALGFLPVLGMALHNWVYGGVFALFTSTATHPGTMVMPPAAYFAAVVELTHGQFLGEHVVKAFWQIAGWLAGPSESMAMVPLDAVAIAILLRVALRSPDDPWLRLIAWATLIQHGVGLFYLTAGRYHYLTWLLTLLVVMTWLHDEGLDWLRRRFPALCQRLIEHPASVGLGLGLQRLCAMLESG